MIELIHGDCLKKLKELAENSVDSIVTDPPYGLKFMGKKWDYEVPSIDIWKEALRVLKPGGHLLSFGGTRTYHRMVVNIEDAGFEIRDQIAWLYGQGFPKSTNVLKSGLKQGIFCDCESNTKREMRPLSESDVSETFDVENEQRQVLQSRLSEQSSQEAVLRSESKKSASTREKSSMEGRGNLQKEQGELHRTEICEMPERVPSDGQDGWLCDGTPINNGQTFKQNSSKSRSGSSQRPQHEKQSDSKSRIIPEQSSAQTCGSCGKALCDSGLGSALKPANEPIAVARKPLEKGLTVAENVIKWGTGAINIDGSRIVTQEKDDYGRSAANSKGTINAHNGFEGKSFKIDERAADYASSLGRWPANIILDEAAAEMLDEQVGYLVGAGNKSTKKAEGKTDKSVFGAGGDGTPSTLYDRGGSASRFFYVAKASKSERNAGLDSYEQVDISNECKEENTVAVQLLQKVISESMVRWNTGECGKKLTAIYQKECKSIISTEINKIIESKTLNVLIHLLTNENIQDALTDLSPVENAESLKKFLLTITNEKMELALGAANVALKMLYSVSANENSKDFSNFHSTVKPIKLMQYLINLVTPPQGTVLDPFMGSGSTGVAAKNINCKFIGIELNEEYFEIAKKRIENCKQKNLSNGAEIR